MNIILLGLVSITIIVGTFSSILTQTTRVLSRRINNSTYVPEDLQRYLIPNNLRRIYGIWTILIICVFVFSLYLTKWYVAIIILLMVFISTSVISDLVKTKAMTRILLDIIKADLLNRKSSIHQNEEHYESITKIIERMDESTIEYMS